MATSTAQHPEISVRDAASRLGLSPRQVQRMAVDGEFGRVRRIPGGRGYLMLNRRRVERVAAARAGE